ncbi:hypothetical protein GCM10009853_078810 [Glycomyces scopariae]
MPSSAATLRIETVSSPPRSATASAAAVISGRLRTAGRPVAARSGRSQIGSS